MCIRHLCLGLYYHSVWWSSHVLWFSSEFWRMLPGNLCLCLRSRFANRSYGMVSDKKRTGSSKALMTGSASDALWPGRRFRIFEVLDGFYREALATHIDLTLSAERVIRANNCYSNRNRENRCVKIQNISLNSTRLF